MKPTFLFPVLLAVALVAAARVPRDTLSDAALVKYATPLHASRDFAKYPKDGTVIGTHHDAKVIATVRCSDVCPDYTRLVLHYDAKPGADCRAVRGQEVDVLMPFAIAVVKEKYCVPAALVADELYTAP